MHNQHNHNLVGGLDVPPDSDARGDPLQSIEKALGGQKNQLKAIKVVKKYPLFGFPSSVWFYLYGNNPIAVPHPLFLKSHVLFCILVAPFAILVDFFFFFSLFKNDKIALTFSTVGN